MSEQDDNNLNLEYIELLVSRSSLHLGGIKKSAEKRWGSGEFKPYFKTVPCMLHKSNTIVLATK